jgi:hypothetical protein
LLISYGLMPLLDLLIGEDQNNPPEAVVPQLERERYYRWLTWLTVPLHFVALVGCAWWMGTRPVVVGGADARLRGRHRLGARQAEPGASAKWRGYARSVVTSVGPTNAKS